MFYLSSIAADLLSIVSTLALTVHLVAIYFLNYILLLESLTLIWAPDILVPRRNNSLWAGKGWYKLAQKNQHVPMVQPFLD